MRIAIIGGGIAGLTAAYELARLRSEGAPVKGVLFEASNRFGGIVETVREGGFTVESGPDAWVSAKPWAEELVRELGLADELIGSNDATRKTYLYLDRRLVPMPEGMNLMVPTNLEALDGSALFSPEAIAAYRAEPARASELRAAAPSHDESIAAFTLRHFGREVLERVAAPLLSGILGGDVHTLSVRAVMPAFVAMEREHGSLITALQPAAKRPEAPVPIFTTLRDGLGTLVDGLVAAVPAEWLRLNAAVDGLIPPGADDPRWSVAVSSGGRQTSEAFDAVLLATPHDATRRLLAGVDLSAADLLPAEASSAVLVAFCHADAASVPVPPGFGFLVPQSGGDAAASLLLACTFVDQKFAGRVPPAGRLVRAYFGGAAADRLALCSNDEIAAIARMELARVLNSRQLAPPPVLTVVRRLPKSLPQYAVGHLDRVAELKRRLAGLPGLQLIGNSLHGVGLPDLIREARAAARRQGSGVRDHGSGGR